MEGGSSKHKTSVSINEDIHDHCKYWAEFEDNYFANGASRQAFMGTLHGDGPRDGSPCVTKVVTRDLAESINMLQYLKVSKAAYNFAERFSDIFPSLPAVQNYPSDFKMEIIIPLIAKIDQISSWGSLGTPVENDLYMKRHEHVAIEPYISGTYEKFNSNYGYEKSSHHLMTAFCHWTWSISHHNLMVCDLQGVMSTEKYILTDPAIHSYNLEYGDTDLGVAGMHMVLDNHKCNQLCHELGLAPVPENATGGGRCSTTYDFQVTKETRQRANQREWHDTQPM